jgi:hypothetical protein
MNVTSHSLVAVTLAMSLASLCCCSSQPRKNDPPDSGDTDDAGVVPAWSTPGWEMSWVVQAGGGENIHEYPGDMGLGLCPAADDGVFVTGYTYSEDALFGEGTANEISYLPPDEGLIYLARYDEHGTPAWVSRASTAGLGASSCAATEDGGTIIAGTADNSEWYGSNVFGAGEPGVVDLDLAGQRCPFIAGFNADGSFEWITVGDDPQAYGFAFSMATAPSGEFCVAGNIFEPFTFRTEQGEVAVLGTGIEGPATTVDGYLARFAADGTPLWARELNGEEWNYCRSTIVLEDGSCAVACTYKGSAVLDGGGAPSASFEVGEEEIGALVAVYSPGGDLAWSRDLGFRGAHLSLSAVVAIGPDSTLVVGGMFQGVFQEDSASEILSEGADLYLLKLSLEGDILWTAVAQGPGDSQVGAEGIHGVTISPEGDIAVAGSYSGTKTFGAGEPGETTLVSGAGEKWFNGFAALYSPEGRLRWAIPVALGPAKDLTCPYNWGEQEAMDVAFAGPDALYITGMFLKDAAFGTSPESMVTLQPYGCTDMFLMKLERIEAPR